MGRGTGFSRGLSLALVPLMFVGLISSGCSKSESPAASPPQLRADDKVSASFGVRGTGDLTLAIQKSALEKEFLWAGEFIQLVPNTSFKTIKSRIVLFKLAGRELIMLESPQGSLVSEYYPVNLVVAKFPIVSQTESEIVFDFNAGMTAIYNSSTWGTYSPNEGPTVTNRSLAFQNSFLAEVRETQNHLVIRQVGQIVLDVGRSKVEAKYFLSPYRPNPAFVPFKSPIKDKVGYFESAPVLSGNGSDVATVYAAKYSIDKPIVFAISANTPAELQPVFKEAILYWNRILGSNRVQVVQLTDLSITAPAADYNVFQWVESDEAGAAYADAHVDPRTGEVIRSQMYMPSAFFVGGKASVAIRMRNYLAKERAKRTRNATHAHAIDNGGALGLYSLCDDRMDIHAAEQLMELAMSNVPEATFKEVVFDYVSNTVAHEVGHVLGLRHNFAGSLASNYPRASVRDEFAHYVASGAKNVRDLRPSSSVMDYLSFEERAMSGDLVRDAAAIPFAHDAKAMGVLYLGQPLDESIPLFCTEDHLAYADCRRRDIGASILNDSATALGEKLDEYASSLLYTLLAEKEDGGELARVYFAPANSAKSLMDYRNQILQVLKKDAGFLQVRKQVETPAYDLARIQELEQSFLEKEIAASGGLKALLSPVHEGFAEKANLRLEAMLGLPETLSTTSHSERATIAQIGRTVFAQIEKSLLNEDLRALSLASIRATDASFKLTANPKILAELTQIYAERAESVVMAKGTVVLETPFAKADGQIVILSLPKYHHEHATRLQGAALLAADLSSRLDFGLVERAALKKKLQADMKPLADVELKDATNSALTSDARVWILENLKVLKALD